MSHRTRELPPASGFAHIIRELRYHEVSRQSGAVLLIAVLALAADPVPALVYIGLPIAFLGMLVRLHASGFVVKNKELATTGPYALVRHPLYTGNIVLIVGFALASSLWWSLPLSIAFFWFYYPAAIEYEDRKLQRLFGDAWERWSSETPALMPKLANADRLFAGSWSFVKSTVRNGEVFIAIYILACMAWIVWHMSPT
jgi:protein-S-isoprenylcysteine O-methyltransferase Ste14